MNQLAEVVIGTDVLRGDNVCGRVQRVVVDPATRALTHLVVESNGRPSGGRLVPIELVEMTTLEIRLRCTIAEFDALEPAEETVDLPEAAGSAECPPGTTLSPPYYGLASDSLGMGSLGMMNGPLKITLDRVPGGEVEIHRGEHVHATDGNIGRVQGLIVDRNDNHVSHVLLDEGHLWGEKRVAIPVSAVDDVNDGVQLNLSKNQVRDLPDMLTDTDESGLGDQHG